MCGVMKGRWIFVCGALLLLLCANDAYARGKYQRTEDRKTLIWNSYPRRGEVVTWSGDRDKDRYATGQGTLTWYRTDRSLLTGFHIPTTKHVAVSRYSGKMVRGKLSGAVVQVDAKGRTSHGTFVSGRKAKDWKAGPAPIANEQPAEPVQHDVAAAAKPETESEPPAPGAGPTVATVPQPAEGPPQSAKQNVAAPAVNSESVREQAITSSAPKPPAAKPAVAQKSGDDMDDSLKSLVGPPSLLRAKGGAAAPPKPSVAPVAATSQSSIPSATSTASSPPPAGPRLSAVQVIELADTEAHRQGYNLGEYQRPQADYTAADETWSVSYNQTDADGVGKQFSVSVEDKTKKTSVVAGR